MATAANIKKGAICLGVSFLIISLNFGSQIRKINIRNILTKVGQNSQ
jgi:hypothetical protein